MKNILGLDMGPNSIGWAVVNADTSEEKKEILRGIEAAGVRVLPMDADTLGKFNRGNSQSQTKERTRRRSVRRLAERAKLRRQRLNRVLQVLGLLPEHYAAALDRYGKFLTPEGCPLEWAPEKDGGRRFLFEAAFREMVADFQAHCPAGVLPSQKFPHDWTLYYLRRKALTEKISREELAWVLLSFNQKRGYHQLRGEEEELTGKKRTEERFDEQVVTDVEDAGPAKGGKRTFIVTLTDGTRGKTELCERPDWTGKKLSLIITTDLDKNGLPRYDEQLDGPSRRFKVPTEEEWDTQWALVKAKAEHDISTSGTTVGCYIYQHLRENPSVKVRGRLVRTIDRRFYRDELLRILKTQEQFHPELQDAAKLDDCLAELYPHNEPHRQEARSRGMAGFLADDVIFYQRPLRSKKSLIADCPYESHEYVDHETGEIRRVPVKCVARSNPLFQEFRLWQFIANLRILRRENQS